MAASGKHLDSDGATVIVAKTWPDATAGDVQTAKKFGIENNGTVDFATLVASILAISGNDGATELRIGLDTATLSHPWNVVAGTPTAGGAFTAGTYFVVITAFNGTGETTSSAEVTFTVTANQKVTITWDEVVGASGYRVYLSTTSGVYGASSKVGGDITPSSTHTVTINDETVGAGQPPSDNTTGGLSPAYGTPPALSTTPISFGSIKKTQQAFYWVNRVIPQSTPSDGNPRAAQISFAYTT
jgi:hypothetical protein